MKVLVPIQITDSMVDSSDIIEPSADDPSVWSSGTSYSSIGTRVRVASTHKIYENLVAVTGGDSPEISITRAVPKWLEVGYVNRYRMFDILRNTATETASSPMSITIAAGQTFDSLAILGILNVTTIQITAVSADTEVRYDTTITVNTRDTLSWYDYFFLDFSPKSSIIVSDIPTEFGNLEITITFTGSDVMYIGSCIIGNSIYLGGTQMGASVDALNFSSIDRDIYGIANVVPRRSVPKTTQRIFVAKENLANLLEVREALNATPAVWYGVDSIEDDYFEALTILGVYREFSIDIDNPIGVMADIELEEV